MRRLHKAALALAVVAGTGALVWVTSATGSGTGGPPIPPPPLPVGGPAVSTTMVPGPTPAELAAASLVLTRDDGSDLAQLLHGHAYSVRRTSYVTENGQVRGIALDLQFASPVAFVGSLPGNSPVPSGPEFQVRSMTGLIVIVDFAKNAVTFAAPDPGSDIAPGPLEFNPGPGRDND